MTTIADIAGDNAVHEIQLSGLTRWVQIIITGVGTARVGDSTVTSSRGLPIAAGGGFFLPYKGNASFYNPGGLFVYVPSGATASVGYDS